jgi:hypothetical protein
LTGSNTTKHLSAVQRRLSRKKKTKKLKEKIEIYAKTANSRGD